jgi:hypothetical protein
MPLVNPSTGGGGSGGSVDGTPINPSSIGATTPGDAVFKGVRTALTLKSTDVSAFDGTPQILFKEPDSYNGPHRLMLFEDNTFYIDANGAGTRLFLSGGSGNPSLIIADGYLTLGSIQLSSTNTGELVQRNGANVQKWILSNGYTDSSNFSQLEVSFDNDNSWVTFKANVQGTGNPIARFTFEQSMLVTGPITTTDYFQCAGFINAAGGQINFFNGSSSNAAFFSPGNGSGVIKVRKGDDSGDADLSAGQITAATKVIALGGFNVNGSDGVTGTFSVPTSITVSGGLITAIS